MKRLLAVLALVALLTGFATAGTVTGTLAYPNTAILLNDSTITFALSQPAYVSGSFLVVPASVSCYTSNQGNVVGLQDALVAPTVTPSIVTGSLPNATYYTEISYWYGAGGAGQESLPSPETSTLLTGAGELTINAPVIHPANATGYNVYIGTSSGAETLQIHVTGWGNAVQSTPLSGAGASPLTTNTTPCTLKFQDELIPTGTWYNASIVDAGGNTLPGFPQRWQLWGGANGTVNLSNGFPVSFNLTIFPTPIQANPPNSAAQSINSALTVQGALTVNGGLTAAGGFNQPTLTHPTISTGIANNGTGLQHVRVTACTAAASQCNTTVTWGTPFADTNYTAICDYVSASQAAYIANLQRATGSLTVAVYATSGNITGSGEVDCVGVHD